MNVVNLDLEDLISGADSTPSYTLDLEQITSQFPHLQNKSNNSTSFLGCSKN